MSKRKRQPIKGPPKPEPQEVAPRRKARRTPITHTSGVPIRTQIVHDDSSIMGLRYAAGKDYVCTFKDISVTELAQRPMYRAINVRRMQNWCAVDNWVERRRAWREEYRKAMERAIGTQLIQTRREYMKRAEDVLNMLFGKLLPEGEEGAVMLEPTSLESLTSATRQWWRELIEEKKELADAILPEPIAAQGADTTSIVKPELSQDETRAAALTIVRMRRDRMRAAVEAERAKEEGEEEQKPHMRVIDGEK